MHQGITLFISFPLSISKYSHFPSFTKNKRSGSHQLYISTGHSCVTCNVICFKSVIIYRTSDKNKTNMNDISLQQIFKTLVQSDLSLQARFTGIGLSNEWKVGRRRWRLEKSRGERQRRRERSVSHGRLWSSRLHTLSRPPDHVYPNCSGLFHAAGVWRKFKTIDWSTNQRVQNVMVEAGNIKKREER